MTASASFASACGLVLAAVYIGAGTALSVTDVRERRIPNALVALLAAGALVQMGLAVLAPAAAPFPWLPPAGIRLLWGAAALVIGYAGELAARAVRGGVHAVGMGDVKLAASQALWMGPWLLAALVLACLVALLVEGCVRRRRTFAFGPYICLASGACLLMACLARGAGLAAGAWC